MRAYAYFRPTTLNEAWDLWHDNPYARYIAGGTDLMVKLRDGAVRTPAVISLRSVEELRDIHLLATVRIGGATRVCELLADPRLRARLPLLIKAAERLGSPQIRSVATVAGNLCNASPCADLAPALIALGARVRLSRPKGTREIPLEDFIVGPGETCQHPGEVMEMVAVDTPRPAQRGVFFKQARTHMDLAQVSLAAVSEINNGNFSHVAFVAGAVAPRPLRLRRVEALVAGQPFSEELMAEAACAAQDEVAPISDVRASADYRRHISGVLVRRALRLLYTGRS